MDEVLKEIKERFSEHLKASENPDKLLIGILLGMLDMERKTNEYYKNRLKESWLHG